MPARRPRVPRPTATLSPHLPAGSPRFIETPHGSCGAHRGTHRAAHPCHRRRWPGIGPAQQARERTCLLCAGAWRGCGHAASLHERSGTRTRAARHRDAALPVPLHGAGFAPARPAAPLSCDRARGGGSLCTADARFEAHRRRPLLRWPHDLTGPGARAPCQRARARLPGLSAASRRPSLGEPCRASRARADSHAVPAGHARCARRARAYGGGDRPSRRTRPCALARGCRSRLPCAGTHGPYRCTAAGAAARCAVCLGGWTAVSPRALDRYAAKRSFTRTPEPPATMSAERHGPLLFVVQKHAARRLHYDFRLELDGVLKSWAVPKGPSLDPADKRMAVEVEDHPFDYASFEGVIPEKQYGAGNVVVWDCGVYSPDEAAHYSFADRGAAQERLRTELAAGKLSFFLCGEKLKGSYTLVRTRTADQWLLIKHKDRFAQPNDVLARNLSVLSASSLDELSAADPPARLEAARLAAYG
ncbi:MAG: hypothetical protein JOZ34_07875, partial [Gammaproteobacteria bacterium]|nr:hypothetical protein [Gammaproteobacteria bacterium]